jgi:23S rRNA pseudouridine1911/1915/1917 synthase
MTAHAPQSSTVMVGPDDVGQRLDKLLSARLAGVTRSRVQALVREGHVTLGGATVRDPGRRVKSGETYEIVLPEPEPATPRGEPIPLSVVYEDTHLIVIDKPAGLVVHPAAGHASGTLVNALIAHCGASLSGIGGIRRPGIVHRLDKDTSGLLVVAKTDQAHQGLAAQFAAHGRDGKLRRRYLAFVWGMPARPAGEIDAPLARGTRTRTKMAVARPGSGRLAVTRYRVRETYLAEDRKPLASLLALELETGRTHQIRVHMAHVGHPVVADPVYAAGFAASTRRLRPAARAAIESLGRQGLHAAELSFLHPVTGARLAFTSPLPPELQRVQECLRAETSGARTNRPD